MRYAFAAILVALSLAVAPVQAAAPGGFVASIPHDFVTGAKFYFETVGGWFSDLLELLGLADKLRIVDKGDGCAQASRCSIGLVCVNACDGADCDVYDKRCLKGPKRIDILGEYSLCGSDNLCVDGTLCTRTCPVGSDCGSETHRCLRPNEPTGSCKADADCRARCGETPFPPIGPSAWRASCVAGSCECSPVAIDPTAERVTCPSDAGGAMVCPEGTREACTPDRQGKPCADGICPPYLTCLNAPAYGGTCFEDSECIEATCSEGASPFCDPDLRRCKCRLMEIKTISCDSPADCSAAAVCGTNEVTACVGGACACAPAGVVTGCSSASECSSECPEGFGPACVESACACQRVTVNVPVACLAVNDCGSVSCPSGYDKACIDAKCACTRTVPQ